MTVLRYMTDYMTDPHRHDGRRDSLDCAAHKHHDKYAHNPNRCYAALLSLAPLHPETAAVFYSNSKLGRAALHRTVIA